MIEVMIEVMMKIKVISDVIEDDRRLMKNEEVNSWEVQEVLAKTYFACGIPMDIEPQQDLHC